MKKNQFLHFSTEQKNKTKFGAAVKKPQGERNSRNN